MGGVGPIKDSFICTHLFLLIPPDLLQTAVCCVRLGLLTGVTPREGGSVRMAGLEIHVMNANYPWVIYQLTKISSGLPTINQE